MSIQVKHTAIHPDGGAPIERIRRLDHEWMLDDFEWDPRTGEGRCTYERLMPTCDAFLTREERTESVTVSRAQPSGRWHPGWRMWTGRYTTERRD